MLVLLMDVKRPIVSESFIWYFWCMPTKTASTAMTFNAAVGATVSQYLLILGMTRAQIGELLGVAGSNISQRLRGRITWPAEDLYTLAQVFGVTVNDLMPSYAITEDGGAWVPAAYVAGAEKAPVPSGTGAAGTPCGARTHDLRIKSPQL